MASRSRQNRTPDQSSKTEMARNLCNGSHRLSHVEQIVHDGNPMGHSNAFGGVRTDQRLGNPMNARERFDLIGRPFGSTGTAAAVPDPAGVTLVMPRHLGEVRKKLGPMRQTTMARQASKSSDVSTLIPSRTARSSTPRTMSSSAVSPVRQLPATDGDRVMLAHFLRVRSPKSSSLGCRNCQTTGTVRATVRPMVTQIAVV